jgi:YHS domain-containing protein
MKSVQLLMLALIAGTALIVAGCGNGGGDDTDTSGTDESGKPGADDPNADLGTTPFKIASLPDVSEDRRLIPADLIGGMKPEEGETYILTGRIRDVAKGLYSVTLIDTKMAYCAADHDCPTPWDYCCVPSDDVAEHSIGVRFVREGEEKPAKVTTKPEYRNLDLVQLVGTFKPLTDEKYVFLATGYTRLERPAVPDFTTWPDHVMVGTPEMVGGTVPDWLDNANAPDRHVPDKMDDDHGHDHDHGDDGHGAEEGGPHDGHGDHDTDADGGADIIDLKNAKCPVMGNPVSADAFVDYNGYRIYFCCPGCDTKLVKNPEKYAEKLKAETGHDILTPASASTR